MSEAGQDRNRQSQCGSLLRKRDSPETLTRARMLDVSNCREESFPGKATLVRDLPGELRVACCKARIDRRSQYLNELRRHYLDATSRGKYSGIQIQLACWLAPVRPYLGRPRSRTSAMT